MAIRRRTSYWSGRSSTRPLASPPLLAWAISNLLSTVRRRQWFICRLVSFIWMNLDRWFFNSIIRQATTQPCDSSLIWSACRAFTARKFTFRAQCSLSCRGWLSGSNEERSMFGSLSAVCRCSSWLLAALLRACKYRKPTTRRQSTCIPAFAWLSCSQRWFVSFCFTHSRLISSNMFLLL